jgi:sporulation protein YlmC with PRC-barrel domain
MRLVQLSLATSILAGSGIAAAAVELVKPFEALEQSRRAMIELDKRQKGEEVKRQTREKEDEAKRKREEAEQRKREREEKAQQEAQRRRDVAATKAARGAQPESTSLPPQPSAVPAPGQEPSAQVLTEQPQGTTQPAERQSRVQNTPTAQPQVGAQPPTALSPTLPVTGQIDERRPHDRSEPAASRIELNQGQRIPEGPGRSGTKPVAGASATPNNAVASAPPLGGHEIPVSRLKRMNLHNERGDKLGDVELVVRSTDGNFHIVIGAGGFLGIRERDVRIPLDRVTIRGNRLIIQGVTDDQVRIMPVFDRNDRSYRDLTRNATVLIARDQSEK